MNRERRHRAPVASAAAPLVGALVAAASRWRHGRLVLVGGIAAILLAWFALPVGDWVAQLIVSTIPLEEDVELGRSAVAAARFRHAVDDFGIASLGRRLVASDTELSRSRIPFSFHVVRQADVVNAFAYPGGAIFVTEELVRKLRATPPELAAVLGHVRAVQLLLYY